LCVVSLGIFFPHHTLNYNPKNNTMVVRLRFARHGRRNLPYYHIVAANAKTARNSKPLETIGSYNPIPDGNGIKHVNLNIERVKYWLTVGAQPSDSVASLLSKVCICLFPLYFLFFTFAILSLSAVHDAVYFGQRLSCQDDR
jgi:small subunit ribosomal protein S16